MPKKPLLTITIDQIIIDQIDVVQKELGFSNGALIFKRSPLVSQLIIIGLNHKEELKIGSGVKQ